MVEKKQKTPKVPLDGTLKVPLRLQESIGDEANRLRIFNYQMVERLWSVYQEQASTRGQSPSIPDSGDEEIATNPTEIPSKETRNPRWDHPYAGLQSRYPQLAASIDRLTASGSTAALNALTAFAIFLVNYEPGTIAPKPDEIESDLDQALRGRAAIEDAARRHSVLPPDTKGNAPGVRQKKGDPGATRKSGG